MKTVIVSVVAAATFASVAQAESLSPNSQRYAERNPSAATGRSGSATLAVRTLLGKDGKTVVDVTSGRADGTVAGSITKLQFRGVDARGVQAWSQNYNGLTGPIHQRTLEHLLRGQPLQTHANIRDLDGHRTDVVVTQSRVQLRPDLAVASLEAPATTLAGRPTNISAVVREQNGDVGATADCVLSVDGQVADRANGIWVDAAGTVSCAFTHVFTTPGTHALSVTLASVNPGDWDEANNTSTRTLEVTLPRVSEPLVWSMFATDYQHTSQSAARSWYDTTSFANGYTEDWAHTANQQARYEYASISAQSSVAMQFPLRLDLAASADGSAFAELQGRTLDATSTWSDELYAYDSHESYDPTTGLFVYAYSQTYDGVPESYFSFQRYAGDAVYFSASYTRRWYAYDGSTFFWSSNSTTRDARGAFWPMTRDVAISFDLTDAAEHSWFADAEATMSPFANAFESPETCRASRGYGYQGYTCSSARGSQSGYRASASGVVE